MTVDEREVAALQRLGLTEYESRIYLVLIRSGPTKASEVSFFAQVPRTKTYGAIKELERKGLLRIIPGKPELYAPSSPSEVLMPLVTKLDREVKDSEGIVQTLTIAFESGKFVRREVPKEAAEFWQIEGRQNLFNKLNQIIADTSKTINYCTTAGGLIRAYKAHSDIIDKVREQGATVRFLSTISPENAAVAREFSHIVEMRNLEKPLGANFVSVDAKQLVVIESKPDDLRTDRGSDLAIWTTNKLLVELHDRLFDRVWEVSPVLEQVRQKNR